MEHADRREYAGAQHRRVEDLVAEHVATRPDACAVEGRDGRAVSYAELWEQSGRLAVALARLGVGRGDVVVVALDRSVEMVVAALGVSRTGAAYVPLDPQSPPARNAMIVAEVAPAAAVTTATPPEWTPEIAAPRVVLPLAAGAADPPPEVGSVHDPLYVAYTSGSTGRPKGVVASHRAVAHFCTEKQLCTFAPGDRVALLANPVSDATTFELWKPLIAGATVVVLPAVLEMDVDEWSMVLRERRVTAMFLMAGLLDLIVRAEPTAFASLDLLVFGGEAMNPQSLLRVCRTAPPGRLVLGYGPTETTVFATSFDCTTASVEGRDRIPLGTALDEYTLFILDDELREVVPDIVGELYIGGPAVADGYYARPELTAERFVRLERYGGLVYRSGDLVRRLPDGDLEFVARADRQVKVRGYRVELEEVERGVLATGLVETAVVERVDGRSQPYLVCFYTPRVGRENEAGASAIELSAAAAQRLPGYMVPARWIAVAEIPITTIGKINRAELLRIHLLTGTEEK